MASTPVRRVEGFLRAVKVVHIDIYIGDSMPPPDQVGYGNGNVVDVAETGGTAPSAW